MSRRTPLFFDASCYPPMKQPAHVGISSNPQKVGKDNPVTQWLIITALFIAVALGEGRLKRGISHLIMATVYCALMSMYTDRLFFGWLVVLAFTPAVRNSLEFLKFQRRSRKNIVTRAVLHFAIWTPIVINTIGVLLARFAGKYDLAATLNVVALLFLGSMLPFYCLYRLTSGEQYINREYDYE